MRERNVLHEFFLADDECLVLHQTMGWYIAWNGMRLELTEDEAMEICFEYDLFEDPDPDLEDF